MSASLDEYETGNLSNLEHQSPPHISSTPKASRCPSSSQAVKFGHIRPVAYPNARNFCPKPFGGRFGSIKTWFHKFNVIARDCNWSCEEKLRLLTASLAGRGVDASQLFPEEVRNSYPSLCRALRRKYGTPLQDRRLKNSSPYSCHGCGGKGHYVRDCSTRKNRSTSSVLCYECGGYGYISIYCGNRIHDQLSGSSLHSSKDTTRSNSPDWRATMCPLNQWTDSRKDL